jgi:hypothetical protein
MNLKQILIHITYLLQTTFTNKYSWEKCLCSAYKNEWYEQTFETTKDKLKHEVTKKIEL